MLKSLRCWESSRTSCYHRVVWLFLSPMARSLLQIEFEQVSHVHTLNVVEVMRYIRLRSPVIVVMTDEL